MLSTSADNTLLDLRNSVHRVQSPESRVQSRVHGPVLILAYAVKKVVEYYALLCTNSIVFFCLLVAILHK